jgi:diguanylate cyclase (GGDEF)-like protein
VLRAVAEVVSRNVRPMDTAARYGGDEFAVILPDCRPGVGRRIAERIREEVEQTVITLGNGSVLRVTTSIGGAFVPVWRRVTPAEVIELADRHLYRAKAEGRNLISLDVPAAVPVSPEEKHRLLDGAAPQTH